MLSVYYTADRTLYANILSYTGTIWDGATFVTPVEANRGSYDVPLIESGLDGLYRVDVPAIPSGDYGVVIFDQQGASPASLDPAITSISLAWTGTDRVGVRTVHEDTNILQVEWANGGRLDNILDAKLEPQVAGRKLLTNDTGHAGIDWAAISSPTAPVILSTTTVGVVNAVTLCTTTTNVTGNVGVGSFATGALALFATQDIGEVVVDDGSVVKLSQGAADPVAIRQEMDTNSTQLSALITATSTIDTVVDGIATAVATVDTVVDGIATAVNTVDTVVDGIATSVATVDTVVDGIATSVATVDTVVDGIATAVATVDTVVDGIDTVVDGIATSVATVDTVVDGIATAVNTVDTVVDGIATAVNTVDTVVDGIAAAVTTVDTVVDSILLDTNELQLDWADAGRLDVILDAKLEPTIAGRKLFIPAETGHAAVDWSAIASPTTVQNLSGTTIATVTNITNDVGVDSLTAGALALFATVNTGETLAGTGSVAAISQGSADPVAIRQEMDTNSTRLSAIEADTDELQNDWKDAGRLDAILDAKLEPLTAGRKLFITHETGHVGIDWAQIKNPAAARTLSGTVVGNVTTVDTVDETTEVKDPVEVGSLTQDALASFVTADTGETAAEVGSVARIAQGAADPVAIRQEMDTNSTQLATLVTATNTIDTVVDGIDTVVDGIATSVATVDTVVDGIAAAVTTVDTVVDGIATSVATVDTVVDGIAAAVTTVDTVVDGIAAAVTTVDTVVDGIAAAVTTVDTVVDGIAAAVTTVDTVVDSILLDTNELQLDWVNGGRLDLILDARASQTSVDAVPTNAELTTALDSLDTAQDLQHAATQDLVEAFAELNSEEIADAVIAGIDQQNFPATLAADDVDDDRTWRFRGDAITSYNIIKEHPDSAPVTLAMDFSGIINAGSRIFSVDNVVDSEGHLTFDDDRSTEDGRKALVDVTSGMVANTDYLVSITITTTDSQTITRAGRLHARES